MVSPRENTVSTELLREDYYSPVPPSTSAFDATSVRLSSSAPASAIPAEEPARLGRTARKRSCRRCRLNRKNLLRPRRRLLEKILFTPVQEVYKYADRARIGSDILMSWNS